MGILSKEAILNAPDIVYEVIDVPEWDGKVRIKSLTGDERDGYEQSLIDQRGNVTGPKLAGWQARLVALSIVDDDGNRLFDNKEVSQLGRKSAMALGRVADAAARLSRLTEKDVEELLGNSAGTRAEPSPSV